MLRFYMKGIPSHNIIIITNHNNNNNISPFCGQSIFFVIVLSFYCKIIEIANIAKHRKKRTSLVQLFFTYIMNCFCCGYYYNRTHARCKDKCSTNQTTYICYRNVAKDLWFYVFFFSTISITLTTINYNMLQSSIYKLQIG